MIKLNQESNRREVEIGGKKKKKQAPTVDHTHQRAERRIKQGRRELGSRGGTGGGEGGDEATLKVLY